MKKKLYTTFIFALLMAGISAQRNHLEEGNLAYNNERFYSAVESYKRADASKKIKPDVKGEINYKIGLCYDHLQETEQAETYYNRAIKLKYQKHNPEVLYRLALTSMEEGQYKKAKEELEEYLTMVPNNKTAKEKLESCRTSMSWIAEPTRHHVLQEVQLNTKAYDWAPSWGDRRQTTLLFSSTREGATGVDMDDRTGEPFSDIWITIRDNKGKWDEPKPLPSTINTDDNEGAAVMNSKMNKIYFTRCVREKKKNIGCDIYYSTKQGSNWKQAQKIALKPDGGDSLSVGHPTLSKDEMLMVFSGDLPGGKGGKDLWMVRYNKREKSWGEPVNLASLNTPGDEMFPHLTSEGNLYFSSNGLNGMGGLDIFKAEKLEKDSWGEIANLQYPINSSRDDYGITFEGMDEQRGMFTSNRTGGKGKDDLFSFYLPEEIITLECYVLDELTNQPIPNAKLELVSDKGELYTKYTDEKGMFRFDAHQKGRYIKKGGNFTISAEKEKYGAASSRFSTVGVEGSKLFIEEFRMYKKEVTYNLPEVRYDFNDSALQVIENKVNSEDSLNYLYDLMVKNENWIVELQAHTDCRGTEEYNLKLSNGRAKSCVDYLVSRGIDKRRLVPRGYGEGVPRKGLECKAIEALATEEERDAAHQRNRRTQFKILSFDFNPEK